MTGAGNCLENMGIMAIGQPDMKLPWGEELFVMVKKLLGKRICGTAGSVMEPNGNLTHSPDRVYEQ